MGTQLWWRTRREAGGILYSTRSEQFLALEYDWVLTVLQIESSPLASEEASHLHIMFMSDNDLKFFNLHYQMM